MLTNRPPRQYEVIIVDDGSTDKTSEYLDNLKINNFKVIHQENSGGPSAPRNRGMSEAKGQFVFFADADDYFVSPFAIQRMIEHAKTDQLDVGIFKVDASAWGLTYQGLFEHSQINCTTDNSPIMNSLGPYKLFRKELIENNGISFPLEAAYEDLPFVLHAYLCAQNIGIYNDLTYYRYCKRHDSLSQGKSEATRKFAEVDRKITGIKNYLSIASSFTSPNQKPNIYTRAFRYSRRLFDNASKAQKETLRQILQPFYTDPVRKLLPFSLLAEIDAFCLGDDAYSSIHENGKLQPFVFKKHLLSKMPKYSIGELTMPMPKTVDYSDYGSELLNPKTLRCKINTAEWGSGQLSLEGEFLGIRRINHEKPFTFVRMTHRGDQLLFRANIHNVSISNAYSDVKSFSFNWSCSVDLRALIASSIRDDGVFDIYIDSYFGNMQISSKLGNLCSPEAEHKFYSESYRFLEFVFIPRRTPAGNFSFKIAQQKKHQ